MSGGLNRFILLDVVKFLNEKTFLQYVPKYTIKLSIINLGAILRDQAIYSSSSLSSGMVLRRASDGGDGDGRGAGPGV